MDETTRKSILITTTGAQCVPIIKSLNPDDWDLDVSTQDFYKIIFVHEDIVMNNTLLDQLEFDLNQGYKMEGFQIYPLYDENYDRWIYYDYPNKLVVCVIQGAFG